MRRCRLVLGIIAVVLAAAPLRAEGPTWVTQILRRVPQTEQEMIEAHNQSQAWCMEVAPGQPMEVDDFGEPVRYRVTTSAGPKVLDYNASRQNVMHFGLNLLPRDEADLPLISGGAILERVNNDYISIQVRVQREGEYPPYLHYRPLAAVGNYSDHQRAQDVLGIVQNSVRDVRSIGIYVPEGTPVQADTLRTLVVVHSSRRCMDDEKSGALKQWVEYEYLFVRARDDNPADNQHDLQLHSFTSTHNRTKLHYFQPGGLPTKPDECFLKSDIVFTEYGFGSLSPTARAARQVHINAHKTFSFDELNSYVAAKGLQGPWQDHLNLVLDDIIDGRLASNAAAVTAGTGSVTQK